MVFTRFGRGGFRRAKRRVWELKRRIRGSQTSQPALRRQRNFSQKSFETRLNFSKYYFCEILYQIIDYV